jgi:hypothetical protein
MVGVPDRRGAPRRAADLVPGGQEPTEVAGEESTPGVHRDQLAPGPGRAKLGRPPLPRLHATGPPHRGLARKAPLEPGKGCRSCRTTNPGAPADPTRCPPKGIFDSATQGRSGPPWGGKIRLPGSGRAPGPGPAKFGLPPLPRLHVTDPTPPWFGTNGTCRAGKTVSIVPNDQPRRAGGPDTVPTQGNLRLRQAVSRANKVARHSLGRPLLIAARVCGISPTSASARPTCWAPRTELSRRANAT